MLKLQGAVKPGRGTESNNIFQQREACRKLSRPSADIMTSPPHDRPAGTMFSECAQK